MIQLVAAMTEDKKTGRPRKHDLMTPLRLWVIENFKGDFVPMAQELGISIRYLEDILTGAKYPGLDLAFKIRDYVNERTADPSRRFVLDTILDYPREEKAA